VDDLPNSKKCLENSETKNDPHNFGNIIPSCTLRPFEADAPKDIFESLVHISNLFLNGSKGV
jgi:hypothetical protein